MTKKERNNIIKFAEKLTNEELENEYYNTVDSSLGSQCEDMYEIGFDIADIVERKKYENYLSQMSDLLEYLCEQRGVKLWEK